MQNLKAKAALEVVKAMADAIKELGQVPSGALYAHCAMPVGMSLKIYEEFVAILIQAGLVVRENHLLTWVEPTQGSGTKRGETPKEEKC